jgi:hypothetical protein
MRPRDAPPGAYGLTALADELSKIHDHAQRPVSHGITAASPVTDHRTSPRMSRCH